MRALLIICILLVKTLLPSRVEGQTSIDSLTRTRKNQIKTPVESVATGSFVRINRIFILGNKITREPIILRELTLKSGDIIYSDDLALILEQDRQKLFNTRLFNTVEIRSLELEPDRVDLIINLNERWYTFPVPIFELSDRNFNEWWQNYNRDLRRVNYGLRLYQYNFRGRNETIRATAQFGFQRKLELTYRIPYVDNSQRHGISFDFDYQEAKNVAFRTADHRMEFLSTRDILKTSRGVGLTYSFRNSFYDVHSLKVDFRQNEIADTIAILNPNYYRNDQTRQRFGVIAYQFTAEHRDIVAYPLRGYNFTAFVQKSGLGFNDDLNKIEMNLTYSRHMDLSKNYYISNFTSVYVSDPDNLGYGNFGALGYKNQFVRGYEVYVIEGPHYVLNKTTFKKLLFSHTYNWRNMPIDQFGHIPIAVYIKTFADVGYVQNYPNYELNSRLADQWLSGIGFGLDIVSSYDAVMRLEYTFNREGVGGFFFHLKKEF